MVGVVGGERVDGLGSPSYEGCEAASLACGAALGVQRWLALLGWSGSTDLEVHRTGV